MQFKVDCPHCDAMLSVPEKYHYTMIKCPDCGGELEAASTETVRVTREFIEELEDDGKSAGVTNLRQLSTLSVKGSGSE